MGPSENGFKNSEFVRVRISSLLMSILLFSLRPLRSLRLNASSTPSHERAPPAIHLWLSRAGARAWRAGGLWRSGRCYSIDMEHG